MPKELYFVTSNSFKSTEVVDFLKDSGIDLKIFNRKIDELLKLELEELVRDKLLKAYAKVAMPCVVEHGAIQIEALNGLPGGLSKVVWDTLGGNLCNLIEKGKPRTAIAKSVVGYCDGMNIHMFTGVTKGEIADSARGSYDFQWDPIFIPEGSKQTYAEIGFPNKKEYSQAYKAWKQLVDFLKKT